MSDLVGWFKHKGRLPSRRRRLIGQSMMEFALTLPLLLFVSMAIFDFGRALYTYSEASNRVRNALRYGAILGFNEGLPQYTDCAGMMGIAQAITFRDGTPAVTVNYLHEDLDTSGDYTSEDAIEYQLDHDSDPDTPPVTSKLRCTGQTDGTYTTTARTTIRDNTANGDIILISVNAYVQMITPFFPQRLPIVINGQRTLVKEVSMGYCGDDVCNGENNAENCWNCEEDCGLPDLDLGPLHCAVDDPDQPSTPLSAAGFSATQIRLSWVDVVDPGESSYQLEISTDNGTTYEPVIGLGADIDEYIDEPDDCSIPLYYRLRVLYGTEYSAYTVAGPVTCSTPPEPVPCGTGVTINSDPAGAAPCNLTTVAAPPNSITLYWADNSTDETWFRINRTDSGGGSQLITVATTDENGVGSQSYSFNTLACDRTHTFQVQAYRTNGPNPRDSSYSLTTSVFLGCNNPTDPTLTVTPNGENQIDLSWTDPVDPYTYDLQFSTVSATGPWTVLINNQDQTTYNHTSVTCDTPYYYRVRGRRTSDNQVSNWVPGTGSTTCLTPPPDAPTLDLTAISQTGMTATWSPTSDLYDLEISTDNGATYSPIAARTDTIELSYSATGLSCNTLYFFRVRAQRTSGQVSAWTVDSDTTGTCPLPPTAPTLSATVISDTQINLSWTATGNTYTLQRSADGTNWSTVLVNDQAVTSFNNTGLNCNTVYHYRVKAKDTFGSESGWSTTQTRTTNPCPVPTPTAPNVELNCKTSGGSGRYPELKWGKVGNATTYQVYARNVTLSHTSYTHVATVNQPGGANATCGNGDPSNASSCFYLAPLYYNAGNNYSYYVVPYNDTTAGIQSNTVTGFCN